MRSTLVLVCATMLLIATIDPARGQQPAKTESAQILFNGRNLDGWRTVDQFSFEEHGSVVVQGGEIILSAGQPATGIAWKGKLPTDNYELTLEARRLEGDDFFCGLTFPVGKEFCTLILGGWGGKATGLSNVDDASAIENDTTSSVDFEQSRWYKVRLKVTPAKIEAWVDKEQIVDQKRADHRFSIWWEQEPARPLGIVSWNTKASLKNVQLRALDGATGK